MTTAQQVLDFEGARLGQGGDETWSWYPLSSGTAWCMAFQSMALSECGIPTKWAWVSACFDQYRSEGRNSYDVKGQGRPGDLVAFEWGDTPGGYDHVAMIIGLTATGAWTRNGNVNGSRVQDLWFPFEGGGMVEIARPAYVTPTPPTPPTPTPEEDEMKRYLLKGDKAADIYLCDAGLGWKWHIPAGQLNNIVWIITTSSGGQFLIPTGANTLVFENQTIWVAEQAFVDAIPTI